MSPLATVVIPTYDHGPTLRHSVRSALGQTVRDLEILVIGDGVPPELLRVLDEVGNWDERVRVFLNPKSPRTGEPWRREALEHARGAFVLYLSDDDLWLPDHVEHMVDLLADADFVHALPLRVENDGTLASGAVDLQLPDFSARMLAGRNWIPFSCGAHTMDAYLRLESRWETTPEGTPTDLYMWQKFLRLPGVRLRSASRPTVLHFPSPERAGWSLDARMDELQRWASQVSDGDWRRDFTPAVLDELVRSRARLELHRLALQEVVARRGRRLEALQEVVARRGRRLEALQEVVARRGRRLEALQEAVARRDGQLERQEEELKRVRGTPTWRLRNRLLKLFATGRAARARARRAGLRGRGQSSHAE